MITITCTKSYKEKRYIIVHKKTLTNIVVCIDVSFQGWDFLVSVNVELVKQLMKINSVLGINNLLLWELPN